MELSIVIPAYNEANKIARDVQAAADFLGKHHLSGEIIVVDDGSNDQTARNARKAPLLHPVKRSVITYQPNRGKGHALKVGIKETKGMYVLFADSGLCIDYEFATKGLAMLKTGQCHLAHASRRMHGSHIVHKHLPHRRVCSQIFRGLVHLFMGIPNHITDTQCGFKLYRGDVARHLYQQCTSERFMFDVEIILRAQQQGYHICEFPIDWDSDRDTRFRFLNNSIRSMIDLVAIKRAVRRAAEQLHEKPPHHTLLAEEDVMDRAATHEHAQERPDND